MAILTKPHLALPIGFEAPNPTGGGGAYPISHDRVETYVWTDNVFSNSELDAIMRIGLAHQLRKGMIGTGDSGQSDEYRNSDVCFIHPNPSTSWIFARLAETAERLNDEFFKFDIAGFSQGLQFTRYEAPNQHYSWHPDAGYGQMIRKLSLSIQLSHCDDFEGGELEILTGRHPTAMPKGRGRLVMFPSYTMHRVQPVTRGVRYSLVGWITGPQFR